MQNIALAVGAGIGIPLALSLVTGLIAWWSRSGPMPFDALAGAAPPQRMPPFVGRGPVWVLGLVIPAGVLLGMFIGKFSGFEEMPAKAQDWAPWIIGAAGLLGLMEAALKPYWVIVHLPRLVLLVAALWLPVRENIRAEWGAMGIAGWVAAIAALGTLAWWGLETAASRPGWMGPLLVTGAGTAASVTFALTGHIEPAVICGSLCAAVGPGLILGFLRPRFVLGPAVAAMAAMMTVYAQQTAEVIGSTPVVCGIFALLGGVMAGVVSCGKLGEKPGLPMHLVRIGLTALPGAIAVGIGVVLSVKSASADGY